MKILAIAPHPDDETLGCGGVLLKHKAEGDEIFWLIITGISEDNGWTNDVVIKRDNEIMSVSKKYGFSDVFNLRLPTTKIDTLPISDLLGQITDVYNNIKPNVIYMPFANDVHTDHQIIGKALQSTYKWFRYPHIKRVYMYETLSETEFNFLENRVFRPNVFIDISKYLEDKIETMKIYDGEMGDHPFPRSEHAIRALASLRGSQSGFEFAEAFELVFERKE